MFLNNRFQWGEVELNLKLASGTIEEATLYSDAMYSDLIPKLSNSLTGKQFKLEAILAGADTVLSSYNWPDQNNGEAVKEEFLDWLEKELKEIV